MHYFMFFSRMNYLMLHDVFSTTPKARPQASPYTRPAQCHVRSIITRLDKYKYELMKSLAACQAWAIDAHYELVNSELRALRTNGAQEMAQITTSMDETRKIVAAMQHDIKNTQKALRLAQQENSEMKAKLLDYDDVKAKLDDYQLVAMESLSTQNSAIQPLAAQMDASKTVSSPKAGTSKNVVLAKQSAKTLTPYKRLVPSSGDEVTSFPASCEDRNQDAAEEKQVEHAGEEELSDF